jgi:glycosyltransferase involved in cell wall biosynthesis
MMKNLIYIVPHLSTGGMPQYLLKQIETFKDDYDVSVIEYNHVSSDFVVQRNKIKSICRVFTLGDDKSHILELIKMGKPDIIHFQEIPETFVDKEYLIKIFDNNRPYNIVTTTHSSYTEPSSLLYTADRFVLVSEWSRKKFKSYFTDIECDIWEYPIELIEYNKDVAKLKLNFDPSYKHVLHVGLFTDGKNQGDIFEIARMCEENGDKIKFHFVGNQAGNFKFYWGPLMENKPNNCIVHGEKENVSDYYKASDLFYFPSKWELNPLSVKESLSYGLPTFLKKLHTYEDYYDGKVTYLHDLKQTNYSNLIKVLKPEQNTPRVQIIHISTVPEQERCVKSKELLKKLERIDFIDVKYIVNDIYDGELDLSNYRLQNNLNVIRPTHYGCYLAHTQALREIDEKNYDYTIIMEEDGYIVTSVPEFLNILNKSIERCKNDEVYYVSFGCPFVFEKLEYNQDFDKAWHQDLAHCYLIPNKRKDWYTKKIDENPWDVADLWFNHIFCHDRQIRLVTKQVFAKQIDGFSLIDNEHKIY